MYMRAELVPEEYQKEPKATASASVATVSDGSHTKDSKHRKKIKAPEMKYNKFQMYDLQEGPSTMSNSNHAAGSTSPDKSPVHMYQSIENEAREIKRYLRQLLQRIHLKDERNKIARDWRIVALVLDRLFFFMYLIAIIVSLATIFPKTY